MWGAANMELTIMGLLALMGLLFLLADIVRFCFIKAMAFSGVMPRTRGSGARTPSSGMVGTSGSVGVGITTRVSWCFQRGWARAPPSTSESWKRVRVGFFILVV